MGDIAAAIEEWRTLLGAERTITDEAQISDRLRDTSRLRRDVPAILTPDSEEEVGQAVAIARRYGTPLYPISTGNNWGYGSPNPSADGCVVLDLSGMRRILELDEELGLVTIEPGVTQADLHDYLEKRKLPFLVPVTGAGPNCSLIGNALDRGYGITPIADHFGACTQLRAVLPDGSIYDGALSSLGGGLVDRSFKWGLGPYIDGLFTQSNAGIVTAMTIALSRRPQQVCGFFFGVPGDENIEAAATAVQQILRQTHGTVGSINLMNRRRVLSMVEPYPTLPDGHSVIPGDVLETMAKRNQVMTWTGAGALYGNRRMVAAAKSVIRKELRKVARRLVFFSPATTHRLSGISRHLPGSVGAWARNVFGTLDKTLQLLAGQPSEIALPLCYWKSGTLPPPGQAMDPGKDGCGLFWYSPLVPMQPARVRAYTDMVERVCLSNDIEPLITLTSLSDRCWDSTIPILFDPEDDVATRQAKACYRELFESGLQSGWVPYRSHVDTMDWFVKEGSVYWETAAKIKDALDPDGIISPRRYSLR